MNKYAVPITAKSLLMTQRDDLELAFDRNVLKIADLQTEISEIRYDMENQAKAIKDIQGALNELGESRL